MSLKQAAQKQIVDGKFIDLPTFYLNETIISA